MNQISALHRELALVDELSLDLLIYSKDLSPKYNTYNPTTGSFIVTNPEQNLALAFWVRDGQLYSPLPGIKAGDILELQQLISKVPDSALRPVGLVRIADSDDEED